MLPQLTEVTAEILVGPEFYSCRHAGVYHHYCHTKSLLVNAMERPLRLDGCSFWDHTVLIWWQQESTHPLIRFASFGS